MGKPRLLDLFCCAGGAGVGYAQAGFEVVGVDINPQPRYAAGEFIQADSLTLSAEFMRTFDAIHASPPCQGYTAMRHAPGARGAPLLIDRVRTMLSEAGKPYIIENVEEARWAMRDPILLCGSVFGLGAQGYALRRHRLFECSFPVRALPCAHSSAPVVGVYGGHARVRAKSAGGRGTRDAWPHGHKPVAQAALGMDWANLSELSEAVPPAYTRWLGAQIMDHLAGGLLT